MRKHPEIQLDDEDKQKFGFWQSNLHQGYVYTRYLSTKKALHLHIVQPPAGFTVDHEDRNKLNCKRTNLRIATNKEQQANKDLTVQNTSGYKGVSWNPVTSTWRARIWFRNKNIDLGSFKTKEGAAVAYNKAASQLQGNFAKLNVFTEGAL